MTDKRIDPKLLEACAETLSTVTHQDEIPWAVARAVPEDFSDWTCDQSVPAPIRLALFQGVAAQFCTAALKKDLAQEARELLEARVEEALQELLGLCSVFLDIRGFPSAAGSPDLAEIRKRHEERQADLKRIFGETANDRTPE